MLSDHSHIFLNDRQSESGRSESNLLLVEYLRI